MFNSAQRLRAGVTIPSVIGSSTFHSFTNPGIQGQLRLFLLMIDRYLLLSCGVECLLYHMYVCIYMHIIMHLCIFSPETRPPTHQSRNELVSFRYLGRGSSRELSLARLGLRSCRAYFRSFFFGSGVNSFHHPPERIKVLEIEKTRTSHHHSPAVL